MFLTVHSNLLDNISIVSNFFRSRTPLLSNPPPPKTIEDFDKIRFELGGLYIGFSFEASRRFGFTCLLLMLPNLWYIRATESMGNSTTREELC
jgi:hypothetical protein